MVEREKVPGEGRGWRIRAACRGTDGEMFFPTAQDGLALERAEAAAKRVCAGCPVKAQCAAWALDALPFGVAGGLGEAERAELRRNGRPANRPRRTPPTLPKPVQSRGGRVSNQREAGSAALAQGRGRDDVATECGVSRRTVDRWAAALRVGAISSNVGSVR